MCGGWGRNGIKREGVAHLPASVLINPGDSLLAINLSNTQRQQRAITTKIDDDTFTL